MILFAHRGARSRAPENTVCAFELALELGATGLESDVWLTRDGVAVLDHDGLGPCGRPIAELDVASLAPHVPRLADLYEVAGATEVPLSLDLKAPAALDEVVRVARSAGAAHHLWICHHRWRELATRRADLPDVRLVDSTYVGYMAGGPAVRIERIAAAGLDALNLHHSEWTPELRSLAAEHGLVTFGWDAQDEATIRRLAEVGVDGIYGDDVELLVAVGATPDVTSPPVG